MYINKSVFMCLMFYSHCSIIYSSKFNFSTLLKRKTQDSDNLPLLLHAPTSITIY